MFVVMFGIFLFLIVKEVYSVGVIPAKIEGIYEINKEFKVSFYIFDKKGGEFYLKPDENISRIIVPDCNYWCPGKTYHVESNTYLTNGTLVTILMKSDVPEVRGKIGVYPKKEGGGTVSIIGGVAVVFDMKFESGVSEEGSSGDGSGESGGVPGVSPATTTTTTINEPLSVTIGVSPAKVTLYSKSTVRFSIWNSNGTVDGNVTIEPDENCSQLIVGELPDFIIVPKGTTMDDPVYLDITFDPKKSTTCGISFYVEPVGYKSTGPLNVRRGVKVMVTSSPINTTTTLPNQTSGSILPYVVVGIVALVIVGFITFKYYYL